MVDTTDLNVHQLQRPHRRPVRRRTTSTRGMQTRVMSFGYKHGLPLDVDLVLDCRFLPNPHWVDELRPQTGLDEPCGDYVLGQAGDRAVPRPPRAAARPAHARPTWRRASRYLTVAFGCTGGRHRSVAIAEEVAALLRAPGLRAHGRRTATSTVAV